MPKFRISAPGKLILSGEHAIVYGERAIVGAVDRCLSIDAEWDQQKKISIPDFHQFSTIGPTKLLEDYKNQGVIRTIHSTIPVGSGMGSSAALAAALAALSLLLQRQKPSKRAINNLAFELEKFSHGTPSGIDNTTITYGGIFVFQRRNGTLVRSRLKSAALPFFLTHSGKPAESTAEMVSVVRQKKAADSMIADSLKQIGATTTSIETLMKQNNFDTEFYQMIKQNEQLLESIGVVSESTKTLIRSIESIGGAAKISGAGGQKKGSGMVLLFHPHPQKLAAFAQQHGIKIESIVFTKKSLKIEKII